MADTCPGLWEVLTLTKYSDGSKRQTGSLTLWYDPIGMWCCSLHAREEGLKWFGESFTLGGLWEALEGVLRDPDKPPRETEEGRKKREKAAKEGKGVDKPS